MLEKIGLERLESYKLKTYTIIPNMSFGTPDLLDERVSRTFFFANYMKDQGLSDIYNEGYRLVEM